MNSCERAHDTASTMSQAVNPLGASRHRGMVDSDKDRLALHTARCRNPCTRPCSSRPITKTASSPSRPNRPSASMVKPFRGSPRSHASSTAASSVRSAGGTSPAVTT